MTAVIVDRKGSWPLAPLRSVTLSAQSGFASGERTSDGVVQLRMNNVTTDGILDWSSYIRVPTSPKYLNKYQLCPGDVLFNSTNSPELVGKTAYFDGFTESVVFSNHFIRLRTKTAKLDSQYLARWLTVKWQERIFERLATRWVNQAAVRREDLLSLEIPLPPLPEQKRIADILSRADRLRRLRRYALKMSEGYLQAVFLEMFGDPVTNPMGWEVGTIQDIVTMSQYGTSQKSNSDGRGYPVLGMGNIGNSGGINLSNLSYVEIPEKEFEKLRLEPGDIIFNRTNSTELVGKTAHWTHNIEAVLASYLFKLRLSKHVLPDYFTVLLNTSEASPQTDECMRRSRQNRACA